MELKLDVKTLVIGIAIGVIITAAIGAGSADKIDFGINKNPVNVYYYWAEATIEEKI